MIMFEKRKTNWKVSFRSVKDIDVSEIARKYNGGGHPRSAGTYVDDINFLLSA
jgi:nanoRNase/pAp phosphatase (c-di-AMP/oligoRNAs hydrolase)